MATVTLQSEPINTNGELPAIGSEAPDFTLVNKQLKEISLADFGSNKKLLNIVPSLDTPVCATSTKKFNDYARDHSDTTFLIVSADLPFAQSRFCGDEGLKNVVTLSMMRSRDFARDYGVLIEDGPLASLSARAIVVLDGENKVVYTELVPEIGDEPDYVKALAAL